MWKKEFEPFFLARVLKGIHSLCIAQRMLHFRLYRYMTSNEEIDVTTSLHELQRELAQCDPARKISAISRTILLKNNAPRCQLLQALNDQRADVHTAAAEAVEALQLWVTDEQWLETLQEPTRQIRLIACTILVALGKDAPLNPLFSSAVLKDRGLRFFTQKVRRLKMAQWSPEKQARYVEFCRAQLQQGSTEHRVLAVAMLGLFGEMVPIEVFLPALNDDASAVKLVALEELRKRGLQGTTLPFQLLVSVLNDRDACVRQRSLCIVATQKGALPVEHLMAALHHADEGVVFTAASLLSRRRTVQAVPELLELLLTNFKKESLDDAIEDIFQALYALSPSVPLDPLLHALENGTKKVCLRAITILSLLRERTPVALLLTFLDHQDEDIRKRATWALGRHLKPLPKEAMIKKLKDRRRGVRQVASRVLLGTREAIPVELLLPLLDDPEKIARATAFALVGPRVPLDRLMSATRDQQWSVRQTAVEILGKMGERVPLEIFLEALGDRNLSVRRMAIIALGNQGERVPIPLLLDAVHDRRRVSEAAWEVLERLGKRVPQALLVQALNDPMAHVRRKAIDVLLAAEYEAGFPVETVRVMIHDSDARVREAAILALTHLEAVGTAEPFVAALNESDLGVRKAALLALATLGAHAPREPLRFLLGESTIYKSVIACLQKTHPDILREVAEEASAILCGKEASEVLGSQIQRYIAEAIGNMYHPGPLLVNRLFALLDWPYEPVRRKAEESLRKLGREPVRPAG